MEKLLQAFSKHYAAGHEVTSFFKAHEKDFLTETTAQCLTRLRKERNMVVADIIRNLEHGDYLYKVFQGTRTASRDVLLSISIAMKLQPEETNRLLCTAGLAPLNQNVCRDFIIYWALKNETPITKINDMLYELAEKTL